MSTNRESNLNLPVKGKLPVIYAASILISILMAAASFTGIRYSALIYPTEELIQAFVPNDVVNLFLGVPILLVATWLIIRVATLDGQSVGDFPAGYFYKTAELGGAGSGVKPAAWLDDENLLVQVTAAEKPYAGTVVKLNVATGERSLFAQGNLAGLFCP